MHKDTFTMHYQRAFKGLYEMVACGQERASPSGNCFQTPYLGFAPGPLFVLLPLDFVPP